MNKLKISLLAVFVFASLSASAQVKFGIKGGLSLSALNTNREKIKDEKRSVRPGFNIGLTADYLFNETMGIQSGLSFTTLGVRSNLASVKSSYNFNALQVPVHFAYKINVTDNCNVTLHGGPYAGFILSGTHSITGNDALEKKPRDLYGKDSNMRKFDGGLGFGAAFGYNNCYVDLGWDMGLVNLMNYNKEEKDAMKSLNVKVPTMKTMNVYLSVGYKF